MTSQRLRNIAPFLGLAVAWVAGWSIVRLPLGRSHPLMLGLTGLILFAMILRPQLGVWIMLVTQWLSPLFVYGEGLTLNRAIGVAALVGVVARKALRLDEPGFVIGTFDYLCWSFFPVAAWSVLVNRFYPQTMELLFDMAMGYLIYWLMVNTLNSWRKLRTTLVLILGCSLVIALSIVNVALTSPGVATVRRFEGIQGEGASGQLSYIGIMVVLWLSSEARGWKRLLSYALLPILAAAMLLSGNRSGLIALAVSVLILIAFSRSSARELSYALIMVALIAGGAFLVRTIAPTAVQRALDIPVQDFIDPSGLDVDRRVYLNRAAWRMFLDHPILGVGFGGFSTLWGSYEPLFRGSGSVSHNVFLGALAETGMLGAGVLLLIYREAFLNLWRAKAASQEARAAIYALILLVGYNVVEAMLHGRHISRYMFVFFALGEIVARLSCNVDTLTDAD